MDGIILRILLMPSDIPLRSPLAALAAGRLEGTAPRMSQQRGYRAIAPIACAGRLCIAATISFR